MTGNNVEKCARSRKTVHRKYHSPSRTRQALETRKAIISAAENLICTKGYLKATITAIAHEAGVSTQTVYAVFGSKCGILVELFEEFMKTDNVKFAHEQAMQAADPMLALRFTAAFLREVFSMGSPLFAILIGSTAVSPDLAKLMREKKQERRSIQASFMAKLYEQGHIKPELDFEKALDIFWYLSSYESYRSFVEERGWTYAEYEAWMAQSMAGALLKPASMALHEPLHVS